MDDRRQPTHGQTPPPPGYIPSWSDMTCRPGSDDFMAAVRQAASTTFHPYGGFEFQRRGEVVCFARMAPADSVTVEISGMYAPVKGGGRHAMSLLALLADIHDIRLYLVAASSVPSRMDTPRIVEWYARFGFIGSSPGAFGGVPMIRLSRSLYPPVVAAHRRENSPSV